MRKFYFENENGERINFNTGTNFLSSPSGLGFERNYSFLNLNDGFFLSTNEKTVQGTIGGTIVFTDKQNQYRDYRNLMDWINRNNKRLTLVYLPYGATEYCIDILVKSIHKGETALNGWLSCNISMIPLTPYYSKSNLEFTFRNQGTGLGKKYSYNYDYTYGFSSEAGSIDLNIGGDYDGYARLQIFGACDSLIVKLEDRDSNILGQIDLTGFAIASNESIIIDTRPNSAGVWLNRNGVKSDIIDELILNSDLEVFFSIVPNKDLILSVTAEGDIGENSKCIVYQYWRTR